MYSFIFGSQAFRFLIRINKIKSDKSLLENYVISITDRELIFPVYDKFEQPPEFTHKKLKTENIELSNIESLKLSFGDFILKKKVPNWADKISFPAYFFSKTERKAILNAARIQ
jgi:hypothetical protein